MGVCSTIHSTQAIQVWIFLPRPGLQSTRRWLAKSSGRLERRLGLVVVIENNGYQIWLAHLSSIAVVAGQILA